VLAYPALAGSGDVWSIVVLAISLTVLVVIAWPLARLAAAAAPPPGSAPQRMPDRRSASA
jgi:hypothetical protein